MAFIALVVVAILVVSVLTSAIKIVKEYERGVIFRLGRVQGGPKRASLSRVWGSSAGGRIGVVRGNRRGA